MGNVQIKNGIGYSEHSGSRYIDMAAVKQLEPVRPIQAAYPDPALEFMPWSRWGSDNLLPKQMVADIKACGILSGIIDGKSRFAVCQGMVPAIMKFNEKGEKVIEKILNDAEIIDFLEMNNHFFQVFGWMKDYIGFHRGMARIMLDKKGKSIAAFQRDDISGTRLAKKDSRGRINSVYYSAQWERVRSESDPFVFKKPLLNPNNPYMDLRNRVDNGDTTKEFALTFCHPGWDEQYYPTPLWYAAYKWVKIAQGVPEMKAVLFENNMRVKYLIIIQQTFWENNFGQEWKKYSETEKEQKRQKVFDEIDAMLVGSKNAYKSIFTTGYRDREGRVWADIEIKTIDDKTKNGELLPDSAAANSEIAFSMLWNNAMTGGNQASGLYEQSSGGSNVRESLLMQVIIHEVERQQIRSVMNVIKYFNGWNKTFPGLDFIIPATILTTTDTGGSTKPVVTGDANSNKDTKSATND